MDSAVQRIKTHYTALRPSERKVADLILAAPARAMTLTLAALAEGAGVSQPTVMRFLHALEYDSLAALRLALAAEEAAPRPEKQLLDVRVAPGDDLTAIPDRMLTMAVGTLEDTRRMQDRGSYLRAVQAIAGARLIDIYGVGNSAAVASDMVIKLLRIGLPCRAYSDNHLQQICASTLCAGDVAVGISHSGATRDTVDALRMAKKRGATTIAITNFKGTHILKWADIALVTGDVETDFYTETMFSRISQLAIVDSLYMGLVLQDYEKRAATLACVNEMVSHKVY